MKKILSLILGFLVFNSFGASLNTVLYDISTREIKPTNLILRVEGTTNLNDFAKIGTNTFATPGITNGYLKTVPVKTNGTAVVSSTSLNLIAGAGVTLNGTNNSNQADLEINATGPYILCELQPTDNGTNFLVDFNKFTHVINATNNIFFSFSTNRPSSGYAKFTDVTIRNYSGTNFTVGFSTSWKRIGNAFTGYATNGTVTQIGFKSVGSDETNTIYAASN